MVLVVPGNEHQALKSGQIGYTFAGFVRGTQLEIKPARMDFFIDF